MGLSAVFVMPLAASAAPVLGADYRADLDWLVDQIRGRYAYLPERHVDLGRLHEIYAPAAGAAANRNAFLGVLEAMLGEFHDHHITINTNTDRSPQLVPTGADIWVGMRGGSAWIEQVRPLSPAEAAGVCAGDELVSVAGQSIAEFLSVHRSSALTALDPEADDFALRTALAGNHVDRRVFIVRHPNGVEQALSLPPFRAPTTETLLSTQTFSSGFGAIRIENSLGQSDLVAAFDETLAAQRHARGLILDLRNTPSGGNTDVAEPLMGRFIKGRHGYQRVLDAQAGKALPSTPWVKQVQGRGPFTFNAPLVVLCSRWTGSMGEGMTIGLEGMGRSKIVGTRMAGLCGGTEAFTLPKSGLTVHLPTEKLFHVDGTPREHWAPPNLVDLSTASGSDPVLARGLEVLAATAR